jgi:lysophospholipid acyltransferase (LPLAT)-like uncharacterized protein
VLKSKFAKKLLANIGPYLAYYLLRFIYISCKKEFIFDKKYNGDDIIIASWHGELIMSPFNLLELNKRFGMKKPYLMISNHNDGEVISNIFKLFGFESIRGSSSKNGARVLLQAIKLVKNGHNMALTPDGPRGPRHSLADGIAVIAKKSNKNILAINFNVDRFWQFRSWDKMVLPKPFSTIKFYAKVVEIDGLEINDIKNKLKEELLKNAI